MDYFVYKREYKEEEWLPCSSIDNRFHLEVIFCFTCPDCQARILGAWAFPQEDVSTTGPRSYSDRRAWTCFDKGINAMRKEYGDYFPQDLKHYQRIESYGAEAHEFMGTKECPICGEPLTKDNLRYWAGSDKWNVVSCENLSKSSMFHYNYNKEDSFSALARPRTPWISQAEEKRIENNRKSAIRRAGDSKHKEFLAQCDKEHGLQISDKRCSLENTDQLKDYLAHVINIEKNIYSVSGRLKELYRNECAMPDVVQGSVRRALAKREEQRIEKKSAAFKLKKALEKKREEDPVKNIQVRTIPLPQPPSKPQAPLAPRLARPGLFNKKRVLAENAALTEQYNRNRAEYEDRLKTYNEEMAVYQQDVVRIQEEQETLRRDTVEQAKAAHNEACEKLEQEHKAALEEYEQFRTLEVVIVTPEELEMKMLQEEIAQAEDLLKKLYQARQQGYGAGVIFEKYKDFVAIASFYEYLSSGRCTTLDGPYGAYNLYESEIRMNAIVSQLADVIKSLKQIQKNQFVIYTAINEATNELAALNQATRKMNVTLNAMHGELATISRNTEVTAFYAKKNAELMDTMCFLTALN